MSILQKEIIECPDCHTKGEFDRWTLINRDDTPQLRDKLLGAELFFYHCPHCGKRIIIPYATIYHDADHQFMLFYEPRNPADYAPMTLPPDMEFREDYVYRDVFGLEALIEKIDILERGLNDVAIERLKYGLSHFTHPEFAASGRSLRFYDAGNADEKAKLGYIQFSFKEGDQMKSLSLTMEEYFEHCLACQLDERMEVSDCCCVDEQWMDGQLRKEKV